MFEYWIYLFLFISLFNFVSTTVQCEQKLVDVTLALNCSSDIYTIATWFCWKQNVSLDENKIVHLRMHGLTYDHIGHSLGSIIALEVANKDIWNKYISGVINSAFAHVPNHDAVVAFPES
ncbi:unnamed protein product [Adineta steineri]|uniref:Uncharacterized protein n=1 Tax=Adineta steineri TaxID=433720 RepID=A0A813ZLY6_9BILA|nr:unnamed protein product [Adineta steineri]CAF4028778.1 unnamed protein product [Adineta steineri]